MKRQEFVINLCEACSNRTCVAQLHCLILKTGYILDSLFAAKLNNLYTKYELVHVARKLFDETPNRTLYTWNSILRCYCRNKHYGETLSLFSNLVSTEKPDHITIPIALRACASLRSLKFGKVIHGFVKKSERINLDMFVGSALIELYSKCGLMGDALGVFEEYSDPDVVLWTTIVTGYEQNVDPEAALAFFNRMMMTGHVSPDPVTLVSVVSASTQLLNLKAGSSVHGFMIRKGFVSGLSLVNALLNLYAKTGSVVAAANLFRTMEEKDVISWGSMISCFAHNGAADEALNLFNEMISLRFEPNSVTLISALQACETTCDLENGKKIHEIAVRKGLELDILVSTALIDMYMHCSSPDEAIELFERMPKKDAIAWSSLLCGCVQNGMAYKSMGIFCNMLSSKIPPDGIAMVKILTSCSELGVLQQALCLHGYVVRAGFENNAFVGASLIESYSKCGSLNNAIKVFEEITDRDVVIWSSMVTGYGLHGQGREALELFDQMVKNSAIRPNKVTFLSILSACSHAGLIKEGIEKFNMMVNDYQIIPDSNHYAIMVDLLGRIGELDKAIGIIKQIPEPVGPHVWGALLGACKIHQETELGEYAAENLFKIESGHAGYYILLSNIYAVDGKWENVAKVRSLVKEKRLKRIFGQSVVEIRNEVHSFKVGDEFHPESEHIYGLLRKLEVKMKEEGYVPNVGILLDVAEEVL